MDPHDRFEGDPLERTPFLSEPSTLSSDTHTTKTLWSKIYGVLVSVVLGIYAGLACETVQESWMYAVMFIGEALICACIAGIIQSPSLRRSVTGFAIYFVVSAVFTPLSCWMGLQYT
jgi:hypothetical protein